MDKCSECGIDVGVNADGRCGPCRVEDAWATRDKAYRVYEAAVKRRDWAAAERAKGYIHAASGVCNRLTT